jgi:anaerobic selenocysteine-containing dehydrogenase
MPEWKSSCCVLCSVNCGIKVQIGGENNREFVKIKGDDEHPGSRGYLCNKASRLNYYNNPKDRVMTPLRRNEMGGYDAIDWDTAIGEVAAKFMAIRDEHGGDKIFYYGGGGQANHSPGMYARAINSELGVRYRSNAIAQEKTGEFWVCQEMFGGWPHPDVEHCDLAIFVGKNPWHSHGIPRARATLREINKDPSRKMIVIDPKRTETADLADIHLAVKPARDAWLLAAIAATIVQQEMYDKAFLSEKVEGVEALFSVLHEIDIASFAEISGISIDQIQETAQLIVDSERVAVLEDLGVQMNRHSTLVSYLQRLMWVMTGNFGREGTNYLPQGFGGLGSGHRMGKSPVTGAPIISGLIPCNSVAEEILNDHPDRFRAMIIDSANPVHSLAESEKFRQAMRNLDCTVVIDVAMSETARKADYILPTANQYEKAEAAFFNFEFPDNYFHIRHPLFEAPAGLLPEAEIHARLIEAMGAMPEALVKELDGSLDQGMAEFTNKIFEAIGKDPELMGIAPVLLYRTLGKKLPEGMAHSAGFWAMAQEFAMGQPAAVNRAGIEDKGEGLGNALFEALISSPSGVVFSSESWESMWERIANNGKLNIANPELLAEVDVLKQGAPSETTDKYPFLLSAGERRAFTANTIVRDPEWRRKDKEGALLINPEDAARLNLGSGSRATVTTRVGEANVLVEVNDRMMRGHVSLPNGFGLEYPNENDELELAGVAPNELTSIEDRDKFAGTPWHKSVPARIEAC